MGGVLKIPKKQKEVNMDSVLWFILGVIGGLLLGLLIMLLTGVVEL